jgi:hypothetical protein
MPYIGNTTSDFSIDTGNITNRAVTATKLSPSSVGSNGQVLSVDGSGNLQWSADASGTALTGSTNNTITTVTGANAIQGEANLTFDGSTLAVTGNATFTSQIIGSSSNAGKYVRMYGSAGTGQWDIYGHGANLRFSDNAGAGYICFDRRVGVGTNSPTAKLTVHNTDDANVNVFEVYNDNGNMSGSFSQTSTGDGTVGVRKNDGTLSVFFRSNGISYINSGNVGIGTIAPDTKLHISSTDIGAPQNAGSGLMIEGSSADLQFMSANDSYNHIFFGDPEDPNIGIIAYHHASNSNSMVFTTNTATALTLDSTQNATFAGHIKFSGLTTALTNISQPIITRSGSDQGSYPFDSFGHLILQSRGDGTNKDIIFATGTNGANKSIINASGNVGIGTTSPAVSLEVEKTIDVAWSAANSIVIANNLLRLENPSTNNSAFAGMQFRTGDGGDAYFGSYQNSGSANDCTFYWSNQTDTGAKTLATLDTATGALTINDGDLIIGTGGHGIDFGAQTSTSTTGAAVGGTGAEILNHYEEGTWTPVPENVSNTPTYHNQQGIYTRIGNLVTVVGFLQFNLAPTFTSNTSELRVTGLPFTANGTGYESTAGCVSFQSLNWSGSTYNDYGAEGHMTCGAVESTKTVFKVNPAGNNQIRGTLRRKAFEGGGIITWEMTYKTND